MANLMPYLLRLTKQGCCKAVAAAMHKYDRSRYGTVKPKLDQLAILPYKDAKAALRAAVRKTGRRKFRTALDILEADQRLHARVARKVRTGER